MTALEGLVAELRRLIVESTDPCTVHGEHSIYNHSAVCDCADCKQAWDAAGRIVVARDKLVEMAPKALDALEAAEQRAETLRGALERTASVLADTYDVVCGNSNASQEDVYCEYYKASQEAERALKGEG